MKTTAKVLFIFKLVFLLTILVVFTSCEDCKSCSEEDSDREISDTDIDDDSTDEAVVVDIDNVVDTGNLGGPCYGNDTCNDGLECDDGVCVKETVVDKDVSDEEIDDALDDDTFVSDNDSFDDDILVDIDSEEPLPEYCIPFCDTLLCGEADGCGNKCIVQNCGTDRFCGVDAKCHLNSEIISFLDGEFATCVRTKLKKKITEDITVADLQTVTELDCSDMGIVTVDELGFDNTLSLFPNPNNGTFRLTANNVASGEYTVVVRNVIGQNVFVQTISANGTISQDIQLDKLNNGVYFLELSNEAGNKEVIKFIVE